MDQPHEPIQSSASTLRLRAAVALLLLVPAPSIGAFLAMVWEPTRGTPIGQAAYAISKAWILILPALWLVLVDRGRASLSPPRHGGFVAGAALGIAIAGVIVVTYAIIGDRLIDADQMRRAAASNGLDSAAKYIGLAIYLSLVNSLLEEYVWRWFVFRKCEVLLGSAIATIVSALLFTLHHVIALKAQTNWTTTLLASLGIFIGGCAWSWCYARYRSIWPGYVSHLIVDVAVFIVGWRILFATAS